jgi:hypothetical protein
MNISTFAQEQQPIVFKGTVVASRTQSFFQMPMFTMQVRRGMLTDDLGNFQL